MSALIITAAIVLMVAVLVLLLAVTGGPALIHTEHTLPQPARTRRAPRRADR
ncbi:hypothetical protein [Nocardiopsis sp. FIRDI 009]|uniref:hypothetical protein n=1 Tax=Nocardiopsis sp. FIRDI 009 TaxID=714197 RepID=UPI0018E4E93E|nr:hypothetical protein [Nocardiopsis sp. FIRDI 009]